MTKKKIIIYSTICILVTFLLYSTYQTDNKRIADLNEKQKLLPTNHTDTTADSSNKNISRPKIDLPKYKVLEIEPNNRVKCVVSVRIYEKITDEQISLISEKVKQEVKRKSNRVHIFFLLPEMKVGNGAWVRVDYNPYFEITYLGQSLGDEKLIKQNSANIQDYIGLWIDTEKEGDLVHRMRNDTKLGLVIELISSADPRPSEYAHQLKKINKNGKIIYKEVDGDNGEYYVIEKNGNLSIYDNQGYIVTYKKLK